MCQGRVEKPVVERRFGIDFEDYFGREQEQLRDMAEDGLLVLGDDVIEATSRGRYLLRIIAMCFDRYQQSGQLPRQQYSRAI